VAVMSAFLGLLFIAALGLENIENLINARGEADELAASGYMVAGAQPPVSLLGWNSGNDELYMTSDDVPVPGFYGESEVFTSALNNEYININEPFTYDNEAYSSEFSGLASDDIFLDAAGLASALSTQADPLSERHLEDLRSAFEELIGYDLDLTLKEKVYMPMLE
jgi:hypothetical protein